LLIDIFDKDLTEFGFLVEIMFIIEFTTRSCILIPLL